MSLLGKYHLPYGMAFEDELRACKLDFSLESLRRIDLLLDRLRVNPGLSYDDFFDAQENPVFILAVVFYTAKVVEIGTGKKCSWQSFEEVQKAFPTIAPKKATNTDAMFRSAYAVFSDHLGSGFLQPAEAAAGRLFAPDPNAFGVYHGASVLTADLNSNNQSDLMPTSVQGKSGIGRSKHTSSDKPWWKLW
ncbi:MAG: hypothetical protein M0Q22_06605 [Sulfuritalea sp.]|jgi:hypothetical protein|nr:hypothetical protein [Sulfuritalea sp.]